jgi:hypothetical protein
MGHAFNSRRKIHCKYKEQQIKKFEIIQLKKNEGQNNEGRLQIKN